MDTVPRFLLRRSDHLRRAWSLERGPSSNRYRQCLLLGVNRDAAPHAGALQRFMESAPSPSSCAPPPSSAAPGAASPSVAPGAASPSAVLSTGFKTFSCPVDRSFFHASMPASMSARVRDSSRELSRPRLRPAPRLAPRSAPRPSAPRPALRPAPRPAARADSRPVARPAARTTPRPFVTRPGATLATGRAVALLWIPPRTLPREATAGSGRPPRSRDPPAVLTGSLPPLSTPRAAFGALALLPSKR